MATCDSVRCRDRQSCLLELNTGTPRCVTCSYKCPRPRSPSGMRRDMGGPICGTNNRTYHSWCHMLKDACATGFVIETKFSGSCDAGGKTTLNFPPFTHCNSMSGLACSVIFPQSFLFLAALCDTLFLMILKFMINRIKKKYNYLQTDD